MQSKTSFFNKILFKKNLSRSWPLGLLWFLILFYETSLKMILSMLDGTPESLAAYGSDYVLANTLSMQNGLVLFALFVAIIGAMLIFSYLYQKRDAYMMHAFPLSRKSLYFTGLCALLLVLLLPILLNTACLLLLALASGAGQLQLIFFAAWVQLGACLIFAGIAMFTLMVSGQGITTLVFYFIFNGMFLLMEYIIRIFVSVLMFGLNNFSEGCSLKVLTPLLKISDSCYISVNVDWSEQGDKILSFTTEMLGGRLISLYILVGILLMGVSYILYSRKKLESVHEFITIPLLKWIFQVAVSLFLSLFMAIFTLVILQGVLPYSYAGYFTLAMILSLFYGAIIFYVIQMLAGRSTRVFDKKTACHCAIYSLAVLAFLLTFRFDLWHLESYLPDASQIEWAGFEGDNIQVYTDEENIEKLLELQKGIIADKKEMRDMAYSQEATKSIAIRYKLKSGKLIYRYYVFEESSADKSSRYKELQEEFLALANDPENIKEHVIGNIWNNCEVIGLDLERIDNDEDSETKAADLNGLDSEEKKAAYQAIYEAVLKDIDEGTMMQESFDTEENSGSNCQLHLVLNNEEISYQTDTDKYYDYGLDDTQHTVDLYITLKENQKNTMKLLQEYGLIDSTALD